jgi:predicted component of type VI protein secretion system
VTIGRDASADIVVAQTAVSRRHAEVVAAANGYIINDLSTNGVFVNGEKIASGHALSRADVIRVGTEEFRFYADLAPMAKSPAAPAAPAPAPTPAAPAAKMPPASVTPPAHPATPSPARPATPAPAAAVQASKSPTPPARPATPPPARSGAAQPGSPGSMEPTVRVPHMAPAAAAPSPRKEEPVTTKKAIPMWAGLLVVIAVAAVAAYFIYTQRP